MSITVKRTVLVKVIVTERFKEQRKAEIEHALAELDSVGKRLKFELESVSRRGDAAKENAALLERLSAGLRNNESARVKLSAELESLALLEVGSEYGRGMLEGLVDVKVGDDLSRLGQCEIVVKDDKIVEIRDN